MRLVRPALASVILLLAGCERPAPRLSPARPGTGVSPAPPQPADWRDRALHAGRWRYLREGSGSAAVFGDAAAPELEVRCALASRQVTIVRRGTGGALTVTTSTSTRTLSPGALPAGDRFLDEIAFSRGRFMVEADGSAPLIVPAWAEPGRVIEDCRG